MIVNIDKIFSSFVKDIDNESVMDFSQHPLVWVSMFKKIILNNVSLRETIEKQIALNNPALNLTEIKDATSIIIYMRAWEYIKNININMESHIDAILALYNENLMTSLLLILKHCENYEEYEKCSFIKTIIDTINLHQEKFGSLKKIS